MTQAVEPGPLTAISHADMNAAYERGQAAPLTPSIAWLTRYLDAWWVVYEGGWLRITDELTAADIDNCAARLTSENKEESCPPPL